MLWFCRNIKKLPWSAYLKFKTKFSENGVPSFSCLLLHHCFFSFFLRLWKALNRSKLYYIMVKSDKKWSNFKQTMAHLLSIVNEQQAPIDEENLRILCTRQNIWDHFWLAREDFSALPEARQLQMLRKFYYDLLPTLSSARTHSFNID